MPDRKKYLDYIALGRYDENIKEYIGNVIEDIITSSINPQSITYKLPTDKAVLDYVEQRLQDVDEVKIGYLVTSAGTTTFYLTYNSETGAYTDPVSGVEGNLYINKLENDNLYTYVGSSYVLIAEKYSASNGIEKVGTNFINTGVRSVRLGNPGDLIVNTGGTETTITLSPPLVAGEGIDTTNNVITNTGVRAVSSGVTDGTISVNTNGTSAEVAVAGLGTAAFTDSTDYAAALHTHNLADIVDLATKIALNTNGITLNNGSTATTQSANDNSTKIATTAYVEAAINAVLATSKAMTFEGVADSAADLVVTDIGSVYIASSEFTLGTEAVEVGDLIVSDGTNWKVIQANATGTVVGPASSVTNRIATFSGTSGKIIQDSGAVISTSVTNENTTVPTGKAVKDFVEGKEYETQANAIVAVSYSGANGGSADAGLTITTGKNVSTDVSTQHSHTITITPAGTVSQPTFTGQSSNISAAFSGTEAVITTPVTAAGTVAITSETTGTPNYTPEGTVSQPIFTGSESTIVAQYEAAGTIESSSEGEANYTPAGSVSVTPSVVGATYTPAGTLSGGEVSVTTSSTTVNSITAVGTLPTLSATYVTAYKRLSLNWDAGTLPTKGADTSVATGIASATITTEPTFVGTEATITPEVTATGSFTGSGTHLSFQGTSTTLTGTFTPVGTVSQPTFTGTGAVLNAAFTGTEVNATATYTPAGTVAGTVTPLGSVSQPVFTGTENTHTTNLIAAQQ